MPRLLLNLRHVPEDEADDVRAFLQANAVAFHETEPSRWGISYGGIWISDSDDYPTARKLMDDYQQQRSARVRAEIAQAKLEGRSETFASLLREQPLKVLLAVVGIVLLLGLVALPGWLLSR